MEASAIPARAGRGMVHVVVDTPRGSRNKYKFESGSHCFALSRVLPEGMHFPYDFGSIPQTKGEDGDPLDVMIVAEAASFVGCLVTVRLVGVIEAEQTENGKTVRNDRLLGVPITPVNGSDVRQLADLPHACVEQLEQFFTDYNRAHGRAFKAIARRGPAAAERLVKAAMRAYDQGRA